MSSDLTPDYTLHAAFRACAYWVNGRVINSPNSDFVCTAKRKNKHSQTEPSKLRPRIPVSRKQEKQEKLPEYNRERTKPAYIRTIASDSWPACRLGGGKTTHQLRRD
ncbi:hypothetical protein G7K_4700-t1 [Saitoella complicata NRRL Y-17804]|uniref:Uncharacterized protein n=1 Tax=Saitoella complicata (strain BCRC 22490 / CBS 7301 / JCM 7358 / NBRC 10748 / NRRL Y-17804) TaxID=698492 RepID=A0A0E9NLM1_SAICN|nr:hypothetical protein G7K_4700-t1 [Saitoella complicata NRRL Y-17804]